MKNQNSSRWKSWAAIVAGFVAVTLGGFHNTAWSEDVAPPASGTSTALEQHVEQLDQQVKSLQEQIQAGRKAREATAGRSGFALQSDDGNFLIRFQGLIQTDGRFYTGSGDTAGNYTPAVDASAQAPAASQFLLRRARPILSGTLLHTFDFFFQPDFGQNTAAIYDAYLDVKPWNFANLRVGKFKPPLGVERLQTDSNLTFAERGLTADLIPQRDTGVELYGGFFGNVVTYQAAFTNGTADSAFQPDSDANNAKVGTWRVFVQPLKNAGSSAWKGLGLGFAGSYTADNPLQPTYKTAAGQEQFFSYKAAASFNGEQTHLVPQANYYGGPIGVYAEYAQTNQVASTGGLRTRLSNSAWQAAVSWVLTGENAAYAGVTPNKPFDWQAGTWGAWELAARFQQLQIDPDTISLGFADPTVAASRATAYTVGLNWYLNKFVKFVADYEETWFNGGDGTGDRPIERVVDTRWQVAF